MTKRVEFEGFKLDLELPSNVDSEIDNGVWFDKEVSIWIKHYVKPGMVCVDAGANWGLFTLLMARQCGLTGKVFAFEPATVFLDRLKRHLALNEVTNVLIVPTALANFKGDVLCVREGPPYRSSARIDYERTEMEFEGDEIVVSETLDRWWRPRECKLDFIKIDVDGSEERLLLGAVETIERHKPIIVCEMAVDSIGFGASDLLADQGYRFEIYQGKKVDRSYVRSQRGTGVGTVNLLALPEGK